MERSGRIGPAFGWGAVPPLAVALAIGISLPALIYLFARPLALFVLAFTIAQALSPLADRLGRWVSRPLAAVLLYLSILAAVGLLLASFIPNLLTEAQHFAARAPDLLSQVQQWLNGWAPVSTIPLKSTLLSVVENFQGALMQLPLRALSLLFDALVVTFLSLYLLIAGPRLKRFVLCLFPNRHRSRASRVMARTGHSMGGYVRGAAISGVFVGLLTWAALLIVGLEYSRVLGVAAALGEFVPYAGPLLAAVPAVLVALSDSPTTALIVALIYLGLQQLESYVITPNVMRTQTNLHPALVILALMAGFSVGGLIGALAALPTFAALRVLVLAATPAIRHRAATR